MTLDKVENFILIELDETITLRSLPNGVRDELNLQTGEYIQRIGEVVFDGSDNNGIVYAYNGDSTNTCRWFIKNNTQPIKNVSDEGNIKNGYCDKLKYGQNYANDRDYEAFFIANTNNRIFFRTEKSKLNSLNMEGIKQYLSQNPITVQYELSTPIVKQIDINNFPHSYKDGHVIIESGDPSTNVTAQMTYQCVANRTGQIQEHTEQIEKQEHEINELEMLILENIRQQQNR